MTRKEAQDLADLIEADSTFRVTRLKEEVRGWLVEGRCRAPDGSLAYFSLRSPDEYPSVRRLFGLQGWVPAPA